MRIPCVIRIPINFVLIHKRNILSCFTPILMLLLIFRFHSSGLAIEYKDKMYVLVFNSYHKGLSWTDTTIKGIESVLANSNLNIELIYEFMDTKRYQGEHYFQKLYELYKFKYSKKRFDVIIATDNDALNFLVYYRNILFFNVPVVFCGVNNFTPTMLGGESLYTGVVEETDMDSTLKLALNLHPDTEQIFVINDTTTTGLALKEQLLSIIPKYKDLAKFVIYDDFDIEELKDTLKHLKKGTLIFLLIVNRDRSGRFFTYEETLEIIRNNSFVPIYSIWDFYIGRGIVGGMLTSAYQQGMAAAEMAKRILLGESVDQIPINRTSPNVYMFDYKELMRFNIPVSALPKESIIINQPDTFYSKYKKVIFLTSAVVTTLSLIIILLALNIIKRKHVEKLLRSSEEKYKDLYNNAPDMYHSVDKNGIIIECNDTEARLLGYDKSEIIGKHITNFLSESSKQDHEREFPFMKEIGDKVIIEREFVRKDGTKFLASLHVFFEKDANGELIKTKTIGRDITKQKQMEEELKKSKEELKNLSAHLQAVIDEERKTIAREIHDELGHSLTIIKLDLSWLKNKLSKENHPLSLKIKSILSLVDETINSVQRISTRLRPGVLDHLQLVDAIEWLVNEIRRKTNLQCILTIGRDVENISLDPERSIAVYRIFHEATTNILRHSEATKMEVNLNLLNNKLVLYIKDNGKGISQFALNHPLSLGIIGMRERASTIGGTFNIYSSDGNGTTVELIIPINQNMVS